MIDVAKADRFLDDLQARVVPAEYDGRDPFSCLIGQLHAHLIDLLPDDYRSPEQRVADYYDLPLPCVAAIFTTAAEDAFASDLDAALWMAKYYLRNWNQDLAERYLGNGYDLETFVATLFYSDLYDQEETE